VARCGAAVQCACVQCTQAVVLCAAERLSGQELAICSGWQHHTQYIERLKRTSARAKTCYTSGKVWLMSYVRVVFLAKKPLGFSCSFACLCLLCPKHSLPRAHARCSCLIMFSKKKVDPKDAARFVFRILHRSSQLQRATRAKTTYNTCN
jgi:hypothetical protein